VLVIERLDGQSVICELPSGEKITIKMVHSRTHRIGIEAPPSVKIFRDDLSPEYREKYRNRKSTTEPRS